MYDVMGLEVDEAGAHMGPVGLWLQI